jgi:nicotinate-nucleotide adenylyltransferase
MADRIGIFGGVFDPVHLGHLSISQSFLESNVINQLLILPSPSPPHKQGKPILSLNHRIQMLELAYQGWDNITISDLETRLPEPSYTLQTIKHLQKFNPDNLYFLCIGEDSLKNFTSWYKYRQILDRVTLLVAERPEISLDEVSEDLLEKSIFVDHHPVKISSTSIRKQADFGLKISDGLPDQVLDYILKHHLYDT